METSKEAGNVVQEMTQMREANAPGALTIPDAINDARWLRRTPDGIISPQRLKMIVDTLLAAIEKSTCYERALQAGEETFVLRMRDRAAPYAIRDWADIAEGHGCSPEKVADARAISMRWGAQVPTATKWPD